MQNRVNKVIIGKDIARTASLQITDPTTTATYVAEGEAFVVDKNKNLLAAGSTIADTDIIYIGIGSSETYEYTLETGTLVENARRIDFSSPIQGSLIKSYKGLSADNAATERVATVNIDSASSFAPVVGTEYVLRVVYKDIPEHPGQFTDTFRVVAASTTPSALTTLFVAEINQKGPSGKIDSRVVASASSNNLVLTGKVIPYNNTSEEIDEYRQVDFDVFLFSDNFDDCVVTYSTTAHPGNGNPKIVRDREKFAQSYEGITNRIHFPVIKPLQTVDMTKWYDAIIIENGIDFVSADMEYIKETQVTTEIFIPANAGQTTDILAVLNPWMASVNQTAVTV
jgi:hypothetical protein